MKHGFLLFQTDDTKGDITIKPECEYMINELNEQEKKVIEQYSGFPERKRLTYTKANETEFIITMHYLHKYLAPGAKVADVGAGGGMDTISYCNGRTGRSDGIL